MCGLVGLFSASGVDAQILAGMTHPLLHRGPDDGGTWLDPTGRLGFGHRRLAIIDLSPSGHQPMASRSGRYVLAFNGEIYNHGEIRQTLEGASARTWRGHSDTETLLEAIAEWGLAGALERAVGMFALALWDAGDSRLHLARDRFGEKPLYYGWAGRSLLFGSELKALRAHPDFDNPVNLRAVRAYAARTYIPAPMTVHERVWKLLPGHILSVSLERLPAPGSTPPASGAVASGWSLEPYWSYRDVAAQGAAAPFASEEEALEALEASLAEAVRGQTVADVPVGAFLSGGIDSSTVVAMARKHGAGTVRTFTIGFNEDAFDEAEHARAIARHLGTEHHERIVSVSEAREVIPALPAMYDEPFADSSQIPTHIVSRFARETVTVALSGDGGDELFGGYNRYLSAARMWSRFRRLPHPARRAAGAGLGLVPPAAWNGLARVVPGLSRQPHFGTKVRKAFRTMGESRDLPALYATFLDEWYGGPSPVRAEAGPPPAFDLSAWDGAPEEVRMMVCDALSYLPDDILCKVDRAAMACSLETRVPFLDHRVAAVAARIPLGMKIGGGKGKLVLRGLLSREVPTEMFDRPKTGFGIPVGEWLRGSLRDWAEHLLDARRLQAGGIWDAAVVRARWQRHLSGAEDAAPALWSVLMYEAWADATHANGALDRRLPLVA